MSEAILLVVLTLAAARITRLVTTDSLTSGLRVWWFKRYPPAPHNGRRAHKLGILVDCPWCVGFWVTCALVLIVQPFHSVPLPAITIWAVAHAAALLQVKLDG